jgi:tetratricopeptide (TPR) repeat protein
MKTKYYSDPEFILSMANNLYYFKNYDLAGKFYERAEELSVTALSRKDLAFFCLSLANGENYDKALGICIRWEEQFSARCEGNTIKTRQTIASIYKEQGDWSKVAEYARKILQCQPDHNVARRYLMMAIEKAN